MAEAKEFAIKFVEDHGLTEVGKEVTVPTKDSQATSMLVRELTAAVKTKDEALTVVVKPGAGDSKHTVLVVKLGRLSVENLFARIVADMEAENDEQAEGEAEGEQAQTA